MNFVLGLLIGFVIGLLVAKFLLNRKKKEEPEEEHTPIFTRFDEEAMPPRTHTFGDIPFGYPDASEDELEHIEAMVATGCPCWEYEKERMRDREPQAA